MRALSTEALLQQLPMLQRLMSRLVNCKPTGTACQDHVVQVISLTTCCQASIRLKQVPCLLSGISAGTWSTARKPIH